MRRSDLIWALCDVDERLILMAKEDTPMTERRKKPLRIALIAAAVAVLLAAAAFAAYRYTRSTESLADRWEQMGSVEMPEAQKDYIEERSASIGDSVTDSGVTITLDSVTCTEQEAYVLFQVLADPAEYGEDPEREYVILFFDAEVWVENPEFGREERYSGGGGDVDMEADGDWQRMTFRFPISGRLNDGNTTMHLSLHKVVQGVSGIGAVEGSREITGTWTFEFPLPQSDTAEPKGTETELRFSGDVVLDISDIRVTETGIQFSVKTDNQEYIFTGSGQQAELARAAMPDAPLLTVEARLSDGSVVPTDGGGMGWNEQTETDDWIIDWAAPLDPSEIVSLIFSDGETEIEVPLE